MTNTGSPHSHHAVVRLHEPTFVGEMHTLCSMGIAPTVELLQQLILGDQLVMNDSGSCAAVIFVRDHEEELFHSAFDACMFFQIPPIKGDGGTRILRVGEQHVLVWGCVSGYLPGIWLVSQGTRQFLFPMDRIKGSYSNGAVRLPVGESLQFPGHNVILMPWGLMPVRPGSKVEPYVDDTLCVIEELDGRSYAYEIGAHMIDPFTSCTPEATIRFLHWRGQHWLAVHTPHRSALTSVDRRVVIPIDGQLQGAWSSPTQQALLTLVRPRDAALGEHRLFFNNDVLVHEGRFDLTRQDIFWSPSGTSFVARFTEKDCEKTRERLVSPSEDRIFDEGDHVREVLVGDLGGIQAVITHDGMWDTPRVHGRRLTAVPLAWNLHADPDGAVVWNTIHDNLILKWVDRTHLQARSTRIATTR